MSNQIKKTIVLSGHNTSIALEKEFWVQLKKIASKENLCYEIESTSHELRSK